MALFDIIDDITEKQVTKTDTGDNRIFGVVIGQVVNNYDKDMPGRVCVTVPTRDKDANELKWARVAMPFSGSQWGYYFLPEIGDQVLLAFENGNIEKPYVVGCIPKDNNPFLKQAVDEHNRHKKIVTKNGNTIYFEDHKEGDGQKDKIKIVTAKETHRIELDNEKKVILISDKDGKNHIEMKTENGQMEIKAEKKLTIQVGEHITMTLNGSNGTVSLKSSKLNIETNGNISAKANGNTKVQSANFSVEANAMMKLNSNGAVTIAGTPIKIG
uniref:phage baseplate assembly protein V n=1 Tax=Agathobacter sp. TaxID=2021311 RepID=UPI004057077D